jgi:hypothetical protein
MPFRVHSVIDKGQEEGPSVEGRAPGEDTEKPGHVRPGLAGQYGPLPRVDLALCAECTDAGSLRCSYSAVYLFKYYNMRNDSFKQLREDLQESSRCAPA